MPTSAGSPPTGLGSADHRIFGFIALIALASLTCFAGLSGGPAMGDHESINAVAARQAIVSGDWLIPRLGESPLIRKTPLGVWLIGLTSAAAGHPAGAQPVTQFSARLPSAVAGFLNVLVVCWLGSMLYGCRGGLVAGFICAGCAATALYSRNAQVDMVLTLFTTLAFACFWRGAMQARPSTWFIAAFYLAFTLAMLAKAPLPLATVGLSLAVYWFVTVPIVTAAAHGERHFAAVARRSIWALGQQVGRLRVLWLIPGVILFVVIVGAWPAYVCTKVDNALALWRIEYLDRFTGDLSERAKPLWYYLPMVFGLTTPFMLSIPEAVASPFLPRYAERRRGLAFAFTWAVVGTGFLSLAAFKRPHYLLSVIPAYCLLLSPVVERLFFGAVYVANRTVRATCWVLAAILGIGGVLGGVALHRQYPTLLIPYVGAFCGAFIVWSAACWTYARDRRLSSFALLNLGVPILLLVMWPAIGKGVDLNAEANALAAGFAENGVGPDDEICWADKRPNSSVEFYSGLRLRRLIDENDMAGLRDNRRVVSGEVYGEVARRIKERLDTDRPVYVILRVARYDMLVRSGEIPSRVLFRLDGYQRDGGDELVVFTQGTAVNTGPGASDIAAPNGSVKTVPGGDEPPLTAQPGERPVDSP